MDALIAELLGLAMAWSGHGEPPLLPALEVVSEAQMPCKCAGAFLYATRTVGYGGAIQHPARLLLRGDVNLESVLGRSILLHEIVHALQAQHGPAAYGTPLWHQREHEAYRIQHRYLRASGMAMRRQRYLPREE
jgi:hypothetical protein